MFAVIIVILLCLFIQLNIIKHYNKTENFNCYNPLSPMEKSNFNNTFLEKLIDLHFILYRKQIDKKNKETYFATLIHDLKTPTNAQIQILELMLNGKFGVLSDTQKNILKETLSSEKYMSEIISNILTAYKCDCNKLKLNKKIFEIVSLVNNICNIMINSASEKQQSISLISSNPQISICADKFQIKRVITNLLSNAIKYGNRESKIKICIEQNNNTINFCITGKSNYIPKQKLTQIFDKFSNFAAGGYNNASTGLGLYLSKKIIELHGGKIYAESFKDGTCIFGFNIKSQQKINNKVSLPIS